MAHSTFVTVSVLSPAAGHWEAGLIEKNFEKANIEQGIMNVEYQRKVFPHLYINAMLFVLCTMLSALCAII